MKSNKSRSLCIVYRLSSYFLLLTSYLLLLTFLSACGRKGDPVAVDPHREIAAVNNLKASVKDDAILLTWSMPKDSGFPQKAIKEFVILRAEVPPDTKIEDCVCVYKKIYSLSPDKSRSFQYTDREFIKGQSYAYKVVILDKNNKAGRDSNIALAGYGKVEIKKPAAAAPNAPTGLTALYTQKNIVLIWNEIPGIEAYKVYRSLQPDGGFASVGEPVTPAFTDRNVEPSKKYYYRVSAVTDTEGPPSGVIEVITEIK
ncbi:MAG: fibronectin type III domain-containing protein [Nitrospirae bacterium]|nr:fibronectin type III domain-containing protein [Nitrospirota bacterium]